MKDRFLNLPYQELWYNENGQLVRSSQLAFVQGVASADLTDIFVFAHGWNNDVSEARKLADRFFSQIQVVLQHPSVKPRSATLGVALVLWPSKRWADEAVSQPSRGAVSTGRSKSDGALVTDLKDVFSTPAQQKALDELARLLDTRPKVKSELARFQELMAVLSTQADATDALEDNGEADGLLNVPAEQVFERFADVASRRRAGAAFLGDPFRRLWTGAKEALRQATYWQMKKRGGLVGKVGLGPLLGEVWRAHPQLRMHLIGHSFGARLVSYALAGLPEDLEDARSPVKSLALIQGAFSHFAFARSLPHDRERSGALAGMARRVDGPIIVTHSRRDIALYSFYPRASFASRDDAAAVARPGFRWGALGADGAQGVSATAAQIRPVGHKYPFAPRKFVNLNANQVITRGKFPTGAHGDIHYPQIAWAVLSAAGLVTIR